MHFDELWPNGPRFYQRPPVFKICTDSILLAHFTKAAKRERGADLGSGTGVLAILLAQKVCDLRMDCIDIMQEAATLTAENAALNGYADRIQATHADLRTIRETPLRAGGYDLVVSNPPYFPEGGGKRAQNGNANARDERCCSLADLTRAAAYLLRWGGRFTAVHRPERLCELFVAMAQNGLEPKRLQTVAVKSESAPILVLVEGRRGGKPGLIIEPPLALKDADGAESRAFKNIYKR